MKISTISFTEQGSFLADKIKRSFPEYEIELFRNPKQGLKQWTGEQFSDKKAILFIGACGIAVRAIAPFVEDKLTDSPVLVLDEKGRYVIPILSGHVGGANELAECLAKRLQAEAVITTATDIQGKFAVDLFAKRNGFTILNKDGIAKVSAKVLRGEATRFYIEKRDIKENGDTARYDGIGGNCPEGIELASDTDKGEIDVLISPDADCPKWQNRAVIRLKPKEYIIGIGCKRGKSEQEIMDFISELLLRSDISERDIYRIASIDIKKEEEGICLFAKKAGIPFVTFPKEVLQGIKGEFVHSDFVEKTVGVDNVCERAAIAACENSGELILTKQSQNGITVAIAKRDWKIKWE